MTPPEEMLECSFCPKYYRARISNHGDVGGMEIAALSGMEEELRKQQES